MRCRLSAAQHKLSLLQQFLQGIQNHFAKITDFVGYLYILRHTL